MPTRLERLEGALAEAAAAVGRSGARVRAASAERLAHALAARTPAERLAALDDPILTRPDRRKLREHVGVSLAPASRTEPLHQRRRLSDRLRIAVARWRPDPFGVVLTVLVGGSLVTGLGLAWAPPGTGARLSGLCRDLRFATRDSTPHQISNTRGEWVTVRWRNDEAAGIALWVPLGGYGTATVAKRCLTTVQ